MARKPPPAEGDESDADTARPKASNTATRSLLDAGRFSFGRLLKVKVWSHLRSWSKVVEVDEVERIREAYERRSHVWRDPRYRSWMPGNVFNALDETRVQVDMLRRHNFLPLDDQRILDVGCGPGKSLLGFISWGAKPENLFGVDLLEHEIENARRFGPQANFQVADARELPFSADSFDLALAWTSFSSMRDPEMRLRVAEEIRRVVRPGGAVLWHDFWVNVGNSDVVPMRREEIRRLFPNCKMDARRATLAPPIARRVAPRSWFLCQVLATMPFLRTHWSALITIE